MHEKGVRVLVEAIPFILNAFPEARFVIAGRGPLLETLQQRVAALQISHKVYFPGFVSDDEAVGLFCIADVAVFPSLYEPFGVVALEAMACGAPVIASRVGGLMHTIEDNVTGLLVPAGDPDALADKLRQVLLDADLRERLGANARAHALTYTWPNVAEQIIQVYEELCKS